MKTTTIILAALMLFACKSKEEKIKEGYISKASTYMNAMIPEYYQDVEAIEFVSQDSIVPITDYEIMYVEITPLMEEYKASLEYYTELLAWHKTYNKPYTSEFKKVESEMNSLEAEYNEKVSHIDKTAKHKKVMNHVAFTVNWKMKNGAMDKNRPFSIVFDLEGDVSDEHNRLILLN